MPLDPTIWNPGLTGPAGADGNTILNGVGAPSNSIGVDNDFYIDTATYFLYGPKTAGVWGGYVELLGTDGAQGIQGVKGDKGNPGPAGATGVAGTAGTLIYSGLGVPSALTGVNGDYYFDVTNKDLYGPKTAGAWGVGVSLNGEDAVLLVPHYATRTITINSTVLSLTAAVPADLTDATDYTQVTGIWDALPSGIANGITQQANSLTIARTGVYMIHFWSAVTSSINNTNVAFKFAINGAVAIGRRPWARIGTGGDRVNVSAFGIHQFTAGDVITLWTASDATADITLNDAVFGITEIIAGQHQYDVYDEAVLTVQDSAGINFAGAGVTVTESPTGIALVTIPGSTVTPVEIMDEGVSLTAAVTKIDFAGAGVTVTEPVANEILVTIPGGGGGGGGGTISGLPSGARIFENLQAAWGSGTFGTDGRMYTWIASIDSDVTVTGIEYSIISTLNSAGADIYFELHEVLGHGLPGPCVASVAVDVSASGDNLTATFASPVALTAGLYFATLAVNTQGSQAPGFGIYTTLTAAGNARTASLFITDYWLLLRGTSEYNVMYFAETHLPGGAFTPNSDWTSTSLEFADIVQHTGIPHIGLIKQ